MWKMGCVVVIVLFAISFPVGFGFPYDELMQEQNDDTALVESTIREARAVRPQHIHDLLAPGVKEAYLHTYGDEPGAEANVQGYVKKMNDKGDDGYKHFDSYHKKDSDKFGFEVHSEFGKLDKADVDTESGKQEESKESSEKDDTEETKKAYKVVEDPESGSNFNYFGEGESGESQNYADGELEAKEEKEEEKEEESSPYSSYTDGDGETDSYDEEEKSSYSSSADDGDEESEGYNEEGDEEEE
ncbi:unnamed protein product [Psylliodes chrysocephalus]|uniref:Uncharacterized protein n=1 Tax=Psylliodes chrysocephalus TaxID=3402493 RepID=A0A9P0G8B2_9CUCU|nr:unnamed protein product [Psylliodes chrysocephala]